MKEAGMRIRVEPELRQAFVSACRSQALPAAHVLRSFMRDYVRQCERTQTPVRSASAAAPAPAKSGEKRRNPAHSTAPAALSKN